jgi:hypothetical protein
MASMVEKVIEQIKVHLQTKFKSSRYATNDSLRCRNTRGARAVVIRACVLNLHANTLHALKKLDRSSKSDVFYEKGYLVYRCTGERTRPPTQKTTATKTGRKPVSKKPASKQKTEEKKTASQKTQNTTKTKKPAKAKITKPTADGTTKTVAVDPQNPPAASRTPAEWGEALRRVHDDSKLDFPEETLDELIKEGFKEYADSVIIYHDSRHSSATTNLLEKLLTRREPRNEAMERFYDEPYMLEQLGWGTGYYGEYYEEEKKKKLAPNFGLFCRHPVLLRDLRTSVNQFHAIGYAFDSPAQPDYDYFIRQKKQCELPGRYRQLLHRVYQCATDNNLTKVVMFPVGQAATLYHDEEGQGVVHFMETVWKPALQAVMDQYPAIETFIINNPTNNSSPRSDVERYTGMVDLTRSPLEDFLFVHAWDPWTFIGNGTDPRSMTALLGWPKTNDSMSYRKVAAFGE